MLQKNQLPRSMDEILEEKQLKFEHIFLALRTYRGLHLTDFRNRFGLNFLQEHKSDIKDLVDNKLAILENDYFKLTEKGMLFCDEILPKFSIS